MSNNCNSSHAPQCNPYNYDWQGSDPCKKVWPQFGGSWTRGHYDLGAHARDTKQSTDPLKWVLDPSYAERCQPCRPADSGYIGKQGVSYDTTIPLVDTESNLRLLHIPNSKDPNVKYRPCCPECKDCSDGYPCGGGVTSGCDNCQAKLWHFPSCHIKNEYTRLSNPTCTLRETGINRFQPLYLDPQDESRWKLQGETNINYRMVAKDNHIPCIPKLIDPCAALPDADSELPCRLTFPVCRAPIEALHNYYR